MYASTQYATAYILDYSQQLYRQGSAAGVDRGTAFFVKIVCGDLRDQPGGDGDTCNEKGQGTPRIGGNQKIFVFKQKFQHIQESKDIACGRPRFS